jgi:type I restriction enzyme S subunit
MSFEFNSLDEVADVVDSLHKTPTYSETGYPMVRGTDVKYGTLDLSSTFKVAEAVFLDFSRKYKPSPKDIIITRVGTYGVTAQVKEINFCLGQNTSAIIPSQINADYLFYVLNSPYLKSQIESGVVGSTQKTLSLKVIKSFKIPRFDKSSEAEIASILSALDNRISLLRETNTTLEAIAQTLFKSWFVDFDPVKAKAEGRLPEGMSDATAALFPNEFEESALGLIPKGWRVGTIKELGEVICGKTPPTAQPENYGDEVPFITIPDMHNVLLVTSTNRSLSKLGADTQKKKYLPVGSICISCIATAGLVARVTVESQTNQQINSVVPFDKWGKSFPLFILRRIGDAVRAGGSGGSVFHNLSKSSFEQLSILLPNEVLAQKFEIIIEPIIHQIENNQRQSQTLTTLRDTLLPRLISGQLRLNQAQDLLDEVTA